MKPSICTYSGAEFNFLDPRPESIRIEDIAVALSRKARFGGHTWDFYSVAQHSVWVSVHCDPQDAAYGLLHDAAEAYMADVPSPLKQLLPQYKEIEHRVLAAIFERFGLEPLLPLSVTKADQEALIVERRDLLPDVEWWPASRNTNYPRILADGAKWSEMLFMLRFNALAAEGLLRERK